MERLAQYWDDLDDLVYMFGSCAERIRRVTLALLALGVFLASVSGGVAIALIDPQLALAIATILLIFLLYQSVTSAISAPGTT
ncbi:MAG: hypothetical protein HKN77_07440 [Woeseiaceae bacterium]|nr:hypothetical protein [Woeseiaceae bacterium]